MTQQTPAPRAGVCFISEPTNEPCLLLVLILVLVIVIEEWAQSSNRMRATTIGAFKLIGGRRNPKGWQWVVGGRRGDGGGDLRSIGQKTSRTPAGVPEIRYADYWWPLNARRSGTPAGVHSRSGHTFRWSLPLHPEGPPATFCQPFGLKCLAPETASVPVTPAIP
jgi:hypothetical protein